MNEEDNQEIPLEIIPLTPLPIETVTSSVYSADASYIASRIDYQTSAIHFQFAVLILVLVFLKLWRRGK